MQPLTRSVYLMPGVSELPRTIRSRRRRDRPSNSSSAAFSTLTPAPASGSRLTATAVQLKLMRAVDPTKHAASCALA